MAQTASTTSIKRAAGSDLDIKRESMAHGWLVDAINNGEILYEHEYQRNLDAWSPKDKSEFLASVLREDPPTTIVLADHPEDPNQRLIIDGAHRAETLESFLEGEFEIKKSAQVEERFVGKTVEDLGSRARRQAQFGTIQVNVVKNADKEDIRRVFESLNSGAELTSWEKLHAFPEETNQKLRKELESHTFWQKASIRTDRCTPYKMATRLVLFERNGGPASISPAATQRDLLEKPWQEMEGAVQGAEEVLDFLDQAFPNGLPESSGLTNLTDLFVLLSKLRSEGVNLEGTEDVIAEWYRDFIGRKDDGELAEYRLATRDGTTKASKIKERAGMVIEDFKDSEFWPDDWSNSL